MGCFLVKENLESYKFAIASFESLFGMPKTVITDQDPALKSVIESEWQTVHHLFCLFHIYRNIQKKVAKFLGNKNEIFLKEFSRIQRIEGAEDFQKEWDTFIAKYRGDVNEEENEFDQDSEIEEQNSYLEIISSKDHIEEEPFEDKKMEDKRERAINTKKIGDYLSNLSKSCKSWARYYTYRNFGAGKSSLF